MAEIKAEAPRTQVLAVYNMPISDVQMIANAIARSKLFGIQTPEQALVLCLLCQAEGLHPVKAAMDYHIIQGKPSLSADAMLARFQAAGGICEWQENTDERVAAFFSHPKVSPKPVLIDWDNKRVAKADLLKSGMHAKFPRQMKRARVVSEGIRTVLPGVLSGLYTPEEVQDFEPSAGTGYVEVTPDIDGLAAEIQEGEGRYRVLQLLVKRTAEGDKQLYGVFTLQSASETAAVNAFQGWDQMAELLGLPAAVLTEGACISINKIAVATIARTSTWLNLVGLVSVEGVAAVWEEAPQTAPAAQQDDGACPPVEYPEIPSELYGALLYVLRRHGGHADWPVTEAALATAIIEPFRKLGIRSVNPRNAPAAEVEKWVELYGNRPPHKSLPQSGALPFSVEDAVRWARDQWDAEIGDLGEPMDMQNPIQTPGD